MVWKHLVSIYHFCLVKPCGVGRLALLALFFFKGGNKGTQRSQDVPAKIHCSTLHTRAHTWEWPAAQEGTWRWSFVYDRVQSLKHHASHFSRMWGLCQLWWHVNREGCKLAAQEDFCYTTQERNRPKYQPRSQWEVMFAWFVFLYAVQCFPKFSRWDCIVFIIK